MDDLFNSCREHVSELGPCYEPQSVYLTLLYGIVPFHVLQGVNKNQQLYLMPVTNFFIYSDLFFKAALHGQVPK